MTWVTDEMAAKNVIEYVRDWIDFIRQEHNRDPMMIFLTKEQIVDLGSYVMEVETAYRSPQREVLGIRIKEVNGIVPIPGHKLRPHQKEMFP